MSHASVIAFPKALNYKEVHDISVPLETAPAYPGDSSVLPAVGVKVRGGSRL